MASFSKNGEQLGVRHNDAAKTAPMLKIPKPQRGKVLFSCTPKLSRMSNPGLDSIFSSLGPEPPGPIVPRVK